MAFKDLLVVLDSDPVTQQRVELAVELARWMGAHLIGLYVTTIPGWPGRFGFNAPLLARASLVEAEEKAREQARDMPLRLLPRN